MPKGGLSIHKGGYNAYAAERLANVELPLKTRCSACERLKAISSFSNKETNKLRSDLATGRIRGIDEAKGMHIKCRECNTTQVTEIECITCGIVKGLDGFSKAQRRNNETARCLMCVKEINLVHETPGSAIDMELASRGIDPKDPAFEGHSDEDGTYDDESSVLTNRYENASTLSRADSEEYESAIGSSRHYRNKRSKFAKPPGNKNRPQPNYEDYDGGRRVDYDDDDDGEGSDRGEW